MTSQFRTSNRSHLVGELLTERAGTRVELCGWYTGKTVQISSHADTGALVEAGTASSQPQTANAITVLQGLELADRSGSIILLLHPNLSNGLSLIELLRPGSVLEAKGTCVARPQTSPVMVLVDAIQLISRARDLPFNPWSGEKPDADARYRWKYNDLRRPAVQEMLRLRSDVTLLIRQALNGMGFLEIETPLLERFSAQNSTAFIVPWTGGESFALPQTPQQYKQLLMIGACDRYFQLARSFRREVGLTPYRQLEFTALDLEMSFVEPEDIYHAVESSLSPIWKRVTGTELPANIPRLTWDEAILRYGTDTPDLRFALELQDITDLVTSTDNPIALGLKAAPEKPGPAVRVLHIQAHQAQRMTDQRLDSLHMMNTQPKHVRIGWIRIESTPSSPSLTGSFSTSISKHSIPELMTRTGAKQGDVLVVFYGNDRYIVTAAAAEGRAFLAQELGLIQSNLHSLVWVERYPYWQYDADSQGFQAARHPFTQPDEASLEMFATVPPLPRLPTWNGQGDVPTAGVPQDLMSLRFGDGERERYLGMRSKGFELVLNGTEVGTGSIRCHDLELQERIFSMFGYCREQVEERFGALMEALRTGAPPHGGISIGLDRVLAELTGLKDIREFQAFPKDSRGTCPMTGSPSAIDPIMVRILLKIDD